MSGEDPRRLALEVLGRIERDGAYANLVLRTALDRSNLDRRDRAFVTDLVYGTERKSTLLNSSHVSLSYCSLGLKKKYQSTTI